MTTSPSGSLTISHGNDEYNILPPTKKRKLKDTRPWNDILLSGFAGGIAGQSVKWTKHDVTIAYNWEHH